MSSASSDHRRIRKLSTDPDKNERVYVDEDPDDPDTSAILHLDDDTGICTCHRCDVSRNITFGCQHLYRLRSLLYG